MRITLWLTRPGVCLLIAAIIVGIAFIVAVNVWVVLPPEWAWLDWKRRHRRRLSLWEFLVFVAGIVVAVMFFLVTAALLRRYGINVYGRDPSRRRRRRKTETVEESWDIRRVSDANRDGTKSD